jgi:hemoglobin-like flavoprotein
MTFSRIPCAEVRSSMQIGVFASLGGQGFTHQMRSAWEWFWEYMSRSMIQSLSDVGSTLNIVQRSWDDIMERYTNADVGHLMYDELVRTAPSLSQQMFSSERANDMATKMGDMLGLLVSFADAPARLKENVTWLGRRHVQYKVRPQMITLMGPVMLDTLAEAAGDNWGSEEEKAWQVAPAPASA